MVSLLKGARLGTWALPVPGTVSALTLDRGAVVVAMGGSTWRCSGDACVALPALPVAHVASLASVGGVLHAVAWTEPPGQIYKLEPGASAWTGVPHAGPARSVVAAGGVLLMTDTSNRLHQLGPSGWEWRDDGVSDARGAEGRVLARREGGVAWRALDGSGWTEVDADGAAVPAGFDASGSPCVVRLAPTRKGERSAAQEVVCHGPGGARVIAEGIGSTFVLDGDRLGYVALDGNGRPVGLMLAAPE